MGIPTGVVCLAALLAISGAFGILWGLAIAGIGGLSWITGTVFFADTVQAWGGNAFAGGLFGVLNGIFQLIIAVGLLGLQRWAWLLAIINSGLSLIHPIIGLSTGNWCSLFGLIIPGFIVYYLLFDNDVKRAFGRA